MVSVHWLILAASLQLLDLNNHRVDPLAPAPGVKAVVVLFTATDCPISNRYAPEVQRLYREFAAKGVRFWLVYPNPAETAAAIRDHEKSFGYPADALRDPKQALAKLANAATISGVSFLLNRWKYSETKWRDPGAIGPGYGGCEILRGSFGKSAAAFATALLAT